MRPVKSQLAEMRGDLDRTRGEDIQIHQELVRQGRVKARQITKELKETKRHLFEKEETNDCLVKAVSKGTAKMESLRDDGLRWKAKYMAATEDVRVKTRQIKQELDDETDIKPCLFLQTSFSNLAISSLASSFFNSKT